MFHNPNGFSVGNGGDLETKLEHIRDLDCNHCVMPETKLDAHQRQVKSLVYEHCRRIYGIGQSKVTMAASSLDCGSDQEPGGASSGSHFRHLSEPSPGVWMRSHGQMGVHQV